MSRPTIFSVSGLLVDYCARRPKLLEAVTDSLAGQPRAQSYDGDQGATVAWCYEHERTVSSCRIDLGLMCDGETIQSNDPTGNAAVSGDPAQRHLTEVEKLEAQVISAVERLDSIRGLYLPKTLPTGASRAKLAQSGDPGCAFCENHAKTWSPPCTENPTTVAGNLNRPVFCCRSHYVWIRTVGRAPTPQETQHFNRTGRWPKQRAA